MRTSRTTLAALMGLLVAATAAHGQEDPAQEQTPPAAEAPAPKPLAPPRTAELVFEREVFDYPQFVRRNPFVALVAEHGGPRYEQMRLRGIIHSDQAGESVALLGLGDPAEQAGGAAAPQGRVNNEPRVDDRTQSRRIRAGESWGNVRVLEIRRTEILVQVEEFGLTEERIMRLPTRGQGD